MHVIVDCQTRLRGSNRGAEPHHVVDGVPAAPRSATVDEPTIAPAGHLFVRATLGELLGAEIEYGQFIRRRRGFHHLDLRRPHQHLDGFERQNRTR